MANSCRSDQSVWDMTLVDQYETNSILSLIFTSWEWILYQVIFPCIIVFGYCTNISFIWTVINTPSLHTNTYRYLVSLSISDLLFLLMYYIPRIVNYHESPLRDNLPPIFYVSYYFFFCVSVGSITLVSLERFLAICYPIKHHIIKGTRRTNKLICTVWCAPLCLATPYLLVSGTTIICVIWPEDSAFADYPNQYVTFATHWTFELMLCLNFAVFFFLLIFNNVLYTKIYFAVRARQNRHLGLNSSSDLQHRQVANMLIVNGLFFFTCCSLQIFITPVILVSTYLGKDINPWFFFIWNLIIDILFGLNASSNPVLYLITNKRFRHAFVTVFTRSRMNSETQIEVNSIKLPNINRA